MERKVKIPVDNQFRFVPLDEVLPDKYNTLQFDKAMFTEVQQYWMKKSAYAQKWQKTDPCHIQIKTSQNTFPPRLYIYKCGGEQVAGPFELTYFSMDQALIEDGMERFVQRFKDTHFWEDYDGLYYLVLECRFDEDGDDVADFTDWFVSEPNLIKEKHPKTLLTEYSNTTNRDGIIFQQTRQKFCLRVEAALIKPEAKITRTVFIDQGEQPVQLSGTATRGWTLAIGFDGGVPFWMIDKQNHVLACDSVYIEGKGYSVYESSAFKYDVQDDMYALVQASIELTEKDSTGVFEYSKGGITMLEDALTFPYVIRTAEIGYPGNLDYFYSTPVRIADLTALQDWIDARNIEIAAEGLTGEIAISTTTIVYNRGLGESYSYAACKVFTRRLGIKNITTTAVSVPLALELRGNTSTAPWAVAGPDGTVLGYGDVPDNSTFVPNYTFTYSAPGAGTYIFELWHDGNLYRLHMFGNAISGIDKYSTETSLPQLGYFAINGSTKLTSFSLFGEINSLRPFLVGYRLQNNPNLTDVGVYYPLLSSSTGGWQKLKTIILDHNKLNTAMIDQWFNSIRAAMQAPSGASFQFYVYGGDVFINGQSPAAGVTSASAVARSLLINQWNWTLTI